MQHRIEVTSRARLTLVTSPITAQSRGPRKALGGI